MLLQKSNEVLATEVSDHDDRIYNMNQHLKNVKQELGANSVSLCQYIVIESFFCNNRKN